MHLLRATAILLSFFFLFPSSLSSHSAQYMAPRSRSYDYTPELVAAPAIPSPSPSSPSSPRGALAAAVSQSSASSKAEAVQIEWKEWLQVRLAPLGETLADLAYVEYISSIVQSDGESDADAEKRATLKDFLGDAAAEGADLDGFITDVLNKSSQLNAKVRAAEAAAAEAGGARAAAAAAAAATAARQSCVQCGVDESLQIIHTDPADGNRYCVECWEQYYGKGTN